MVRLQINKDEFEMVLSGLECLYRYIEFELESRWFTEDFEPYMNEYEPKLEKIDKLLFKLNERYKKW